MIIWEAALAKCFYSTVPKKLKPFLTTYVKPVETTEMTKKMIKIALVGFTNSGKSTLINSILGLHLCAASRRPLTTKDYQKVTVVKGDTKIVFVDTPGILSKQLKKVSPFTPTEKVLQAKASRNVDLIGLIVDSSSEYCKFKIRDHLTLLSSFFPENAEMVLILNKIDLLKDKTELLVLAKKYYRFARSLDSQITNQNKTKSNRGFSQIFMISALKNNGVEFVVNYFISKARDIREQVTVQKLTSHEDAQIIEERIRASLLEYIEQEIPYKCRCQLEHLSESEDGILTVMVTIECPSKRIYSVVDNKKLQDLIIKECTEDFMQIFNKPISLRLQASLKMKVKMG